jgi:apolipoprotein N-acyltransferase
MTSAVLLPLLSAVALVLAFPYPAVFPLAWLGLVPYLYWLTTLPSWCRLLAGHLIFGLGFYGGVLYWIPRVLVVYGNLPWILAGAALLLLAGILTLFLLPFSLLSALAARRGAAAIALTAPGLWTLTELARNSFPFGGFPWAALGYTQTDYPWVLQIADLGSVYLISLLIVLMNGAVLLLLKRQAMGICLAILAVFLLANAYGFWRVEVWSPTPGTRVRVGIAQANIDLKSDTEHYADRYFKALPRLFDRAVAQGAQWVLFPEAQNPYRLDRDFYFRQFWQSRLQSSGVYLLLNSAATADDGYYNSAYLLDSGGRIVHRYDKVHLVPFGEYLPLKDWWGAGRALVAEVSAFLPGSGVGIARAANVPFTTLICYEAIFPELSREGVEKGAQVLVNLTNDGWFGTTSAPYQHLQMARLRAVETRRPLLRAANSGFSAVISPKGAIVRETSLYTEDLIVSEVAGGVDRTLFLAFGWLPVLAVIILSMAWGVMASPAGAKGARRGRRH